MEEDPGRQRRRWRFDANGRLAVRWHVPNADRNGRQAKGRLDKKLTRGEAKNCQEESRGKTKSDEASKRNMEEMRDGRRRRRRKGCGVWQRNEVWEEEEIWGRLGVGRTTGQQADRQADR